VQHRWSPVMGTRSRTQGRLSNTLTGCSVRLDQIPQGYGRAPPPA
jgi:hypothetical protein